MIEEMLQTLRNLQDNTVTNAEMASTDCETIEEADRVYLLWITASNALADCIERIEKAQS